MQQATGGGARRSWQIDESRRRRVDPAILLPAVSIAIKACCHHRPRWHIIALTLGNPGNVGLDEAPPPTCGSCGRPRVSPSQRYNVNIEDCPNAVITRVKASRGSSNIYTCAASAPA
jgi:predicted RNA-binding Zn-ribbon protein involved in translation (DUF1610 family)